MSPEQLDERMSILASSGRPILPLNEATERLKDGSLPPGSVSVTIDDGWASTPLMWEIMRQHKIPATVYMTTWYMKRNIPIIRKALEFLRTASPHFMLPPKFKQMPKLAKVDALKKASIDADVPLDSFEGRQFHLMTADETIRVARDGLDIQLHTHRHSMKMNIENEISVNRAALIDIGLDPNSLHHFCYPSGAHRPDAEDALKKWGIRTATTCVSGLASETSNFYALPRFLDGRSVSTAEFEGFLSGFVPVADRIRSAIFRY